MTLSLIPKVTEVWFPRNEKSLALTFAVTAFLLGCLLAFTVPFFIGFKLNEEEAREDEMTLLFRILFVSQLILSCLSFFIVCWKFDSMYFNEFGLHSKNKEDIVDDDQSDEEV